jgi:hypothetical protein
MRSGDLWEAAHGGDVQNGHDEACLVPLER